MRILHVTDTYLPTIGGIELHIANLASRQAADGPQVTILTRRTGPADRVQELGRDAAPVVMRDPERLDSLLKRVDVVHAHVSIYSPLALTAAVAAARRGVPVLVTVHSMWTGAWPLMASAAWTQGWGRLPIQWSAVSSIAARSVSRALGEVPAVLVVPNAVDAAAWPAPTVCGPGGADDEVILVSTLRLARRKRPLALVDLLRRVRDTVPDRIRLRAVLAGDGPQRSRVARRIERHGMSGWVELPGMLDHDQLRKLYATSDIYIAPTDLESFGIAALEARTAGLAVVAKAHTGIADFIAHGSDGLLARTDADLAAELARLITDDLLRSSILLRNATTPTGYGWQECLSRTDDAYAAAAVRAGRLPLAVAPTI